MLGYQNICEYRYKYEVLTPLQIPQYFDISSYKTNVLKIIKKKKYVRQTSTNATIKITR